MVSMHLRVFQKIPFLDSLPEICIGKKLIILAVNFTGPRRPGCARDRIKKIAVSPNSFHECCLPRVRWSRNHEKNTVTAEFFTQDFGLARESSPARPCRR